MNIQELLASLDRHRGSFPEHLVAEAVARRDEVIPALLETLEDIDRNPEPWLVDQKRMVHIHAFYLLALFRETRAYPLLVRIFSRPGEFAFDLAGDMVTQDLGRILASVSGGDLGGMAALIENEQANEYVRSAAMEGMVSLVVTGQQTRDEVMAYFLQLFHKLERKPGAQWDGLAYVCADLWPQEAVGELRRTYEEGLVDPGAIDWPDIEDALQLGKQGAMQASQYRTPLVTDLAKAMGWMQCFHDAKRYDEPERDFEGDLPWLPSSDWTPAPIRRLAPKVGRNEPCPCGSGKKFKKCCGSAEPGRSVAQPN
jgi:hypothetical protein